MATIPVYSPTIPFLGLIPGGLRPGCMVRIKGVVTTERCQIFLQTGAALNPRDDVALHLSIRPNEHAIVRNTLRNQVWGTEERHGGCPIRYGQSFELLVLAEANQYKIAINGAHFCTFTHRMPLHSVLYVSVNGSCVIQSITSEMDSAPGSGSVPYPVAPVGPTPAMPPPPPYTPYPPAPVPGGIGFVPTAPPVPPPPPYTPSHPTHPVGGHGYYKGHHHHGRPNATTPPDLPPAVAPGISYASTSSFGPATTSTGALPIGFAPYPGGAPPATSLGSSGDYKSKSSLAKEIQKTKNFLHDALHDTGKVPSGSAGVGYPVQPNVYPTQNLPASAVGVPPVIGNPYGGPSFPQQQQPYHYPHNQPPASSPGGLFGSRAAGLAATALAAGTTAAVLHKLPVGGIKKEKTSKFN